MQTEHSPERSPIVELVSHLMPTLKTPSNLPLDPESPIYAPPEMSLTLGEEERLLQQQQQLHAATAQQEQRLNSHLTSNKAAVKPLQSVSSQLPEHAASGTDPSKLKLLTGTQYKVDMPEQPGVLTSVKNSVMHLFGADTHQNENAPPPGHVNTAQAPVHVNTMPVSEQPQHKVQHITAYPLAASDKGVEPSLADKVARNLQYASQRIDTGSSDAKRDIEAGAERVADTVHDGIEKAGHGLGQGVATAGHQISRQTEKLAHAVERKPSARVAGDVTPPPPASMSATPVHATPGTAVHASPYQQPAAAVRHDIKPATTFDAMVMKVEDTVSHAVVNVEGMVGTAVDKVKHAFGG